jgi:hypothetical protein
MWKRYANLSGRSNVLGYILGDSSIQLLFRDGAAYLYQSPRVPPAYIERMMVLATAGIGLNGFVMRTPQVKSAYSWKRVVPVFERTIAA